MRDLCVCDAYILNHIRKGFYCICSRSLTFSQGPSKALLSCAHIAVLDAIHFDVTLSMLYIVPVPLMLDLSYASWVPGYPGLSTPTWRCGAVADALMSKHVSSDLSNLVNHLEMTCSDLFRLFVVNSRVCFFA